MHKAFTLIELLVVVLIIGILSAIALPQYQKAVEKAKVAEAKIILRDMAEAYELCNLAGGECDFGNNFSEKSDFDPPTPWVSENCPSEGIKCFFTKDWAYWSEDIVYAQRINNESRGIEIFDMKNMDFRCWDDDNKWCKMLNLKKEGE